MLEGEMVSESGQEIEISFGYQCNNEIYDSSDLSNGIDMSHRIKLKRANSSFSCLSGAAVSANYTLANTNICNGLLGAEILPTWDSPNSFRRIPSSPKLDILSSSLQSGMSNLSCSSSPGEPPEDDSFSVKSMSAPSRYESFLNAVELQVAGGAAGEDRVQAVCSEENGWLFCGIYDGFNGRDAADFLAGTLYERIGFYLNSLECELELGKTKASECMGGGGRLHLNDQNDIDEVAESTSQDPGKESGGDFLAGENAPAEKQKSDGAFKQKVLNSLELALIQAENDFLHMVEREMEDRPDLVSVGSCVLLTLLHGKDLYVLNVGDSRAVLATYDEGVDGNGKGGLRAEQLTVSHTVDNEDERIKLLDDHPNDPSPIVGGKVKGRLKVTRAVGVGYLKKKDMNDVLMGILRVRNLTSPPYISVQPSLDVHEISSSDLFVVLGSDGLFDFFSNEEVVKLVHSYISSNPCGDPAKFLVEEAVGRAANIAGFSTEELLSIPAGSRREYHDDVTVIVIILGMNKRTSKASTYL